MPEEHFDGPVLKRLGLRRLFLVVVADGPIVADIEADMAMEFAVRELRRFPHDNAARPRALDHSPAGGAHVFDRAGNRGMHFFHQRKDDQDGAREIRAAELAVIEDISLLAVDLAVKMPKLPATDARLDKREVTFEQQGSHFDGHDFTISEFPNFSAFRPFPLVLAEKEQLEQWNIIVADARRVVMGEINSTRSTATTTMEADAIKRIRK